MQKYLKEGAPILHNKYLICLVDLFVFCSLVILYKQDEPGII